MKNLLTTTALAIITALPVFADVIESDSIIDAATVYPSGATVHRRADIAAPAGQHQIIIDDLPLNFDTSSLRVTGAGDTPFRIVSVDHRITRLPPQDASESAAYLALEADLEKLEQRMQDLSFEQRGIQARIDVADGRLRMIDTLMKREPQNMVDAGAVQNWGEMIGVLATQTEIALAARLSAERDAQTLMPKITDLSQEINDQHRRMAALELPAQDRSIATIEIVTDDALNGTLDVSYRTNAASWSPVYDLRLTQGANATLDIERHARIRQNTGEAWDNVALTLSTARPSQRMTAPMFETQIAYLWDPELRALDVNQRVSAAVPMKNMEAMAMETLADQGAAPQAMVQTLGRTIVYALPNRARIDGDGTIRQLLVDKDTAPVDPVARATPRLDPNAYLYAVLENTFDGPILPGNASTYLDGAFIGQSYLPFTAAGADLNLPFGLIEGLEIEARILNRQNGDYGLLSTTKTQEERYRLSAKSNLSYAIPLTIYDRAPVSENENLTVEIISSIAASEIDVDGKRGVRSWTFDLDAGDSKDITFGYEINWPGDQNIALN